MRKACLVATAALLISLSACGSSPSGTPGAPNTNGAVPTTSTPATTPSIGQPPVAPASTPPTAPTTAPAQDPAPAPPPAPAPASEPAPAPAAITQAAAEDIALTHAQLARTDVEWLQSWGDRDRGRDSYEVSFRRADTEYNYDIAVDSGEIVEWDVEYHRPRGAAPNNGGATISQDQAMNIALTQANVAQADAQRLRAEFDRDDGRSAYEVDWRVGQMKYDYEIDAASGEIISFDQEYHR